MQSPIIKKILVFGVLSGAISLMLACLGFGVVEVYKVKQESVTKLHSQADILGYNLQSTLLFDDKVAADKILRALIEDKSINRIKLYKPDGKEFASFVRLDQPGDIRITKDISYEYKVIGRLEIDAVYQGLAEKFIAYLFICLFIICISIPASYFISAPIRSQVSEGVRQLEQISNRLRLLADQVATTEQRERKRIAALIHDHLQQILVASKLQLDMASRRMEKQEYEGTAINIHKSEEFLEEAIRAAKSLTVELRPPVLYEDGLDAAFHWLANKFKNDHNLEVALHVGEIPGKLSDNLKILIFESAKELLFNVVKYSGVHTAQLSLKYVDGSIIIAVKDEGKGFDSDHMEKTTSTDKGFGIFSIRERLKLLKGTFKITSHPEQGTEVEISIPLHVESVLPENVITPSGITEKDKTKREKTIRILLVDDHKIVREGIANLLKENPDFIIVAQAENGEEAVEKAGMVLPDIIIMDINMPKLNGIEATRAIKVKYPQIDIIGLSLQDENDVRDSMMKAGAVTLLNKAGDPQDLIQTILAYGAKNLN